MVLDSRLPLVVALAFTGCREPSPAPVAPPEATPKATPPSPTPAADAAEPTDAADDRFAAFEQAMLDTAGDQELAELAVADAEAFAKIAQVAKDALSASPKRAA